MTTAAAPYLRTSRACRRKGSSPSLREIELTIALPCTHLSPASMTSHFEESTMTGTRLMSGSLATSLRKRSMAATAVDHPLVHVDVDDLGAALDLLRGHRQGGVVVAVLDERAEREPSR